MTNSLTAIMLLKGKSGGVGYLKVGGSESSTREFESQFHQNPTNSFGDTKC
jgi:hypothetical protein